MGWVVFAAAMNLSSGLCSYAGTVHSLVSEPHLASLDVGLQALKLSVARRSEHRHFWLARYYDFNVYSRHKRLEKLDYMHWNPVKRGLVEKMEDWRWSSYGSTARVNKGKYVPIRVGRTITSRIE
jgi:hypothetical protein